MPGTLRSSVYLPTPVGFAAASTIAVGLPMMEKSVVGGWWLVVGVTVPTRYSLLPSAPRRSPSGWLHTSGCIRCSGTDCYSTRREYPTRTDQDFRRAAT